MADHHRPLVPMPRGARQTKESDPRQSPKPKRNNIGSACSACKARKLKCSGNPPCQNCLKTRVECTVDRTNDKRRKSVVKRKLEVLEDRKDLLLNLVRTIRDSGDRRTLQLLDLVRSNASLTEIKFYLNDDHNDWPHADPNYGKKKTPESSDMRSSSHLMRPSDSPSTEARNAFDPQSLVDIPLFNLPASPWTTVVQDPEMVSRLVSLWFTWFHPFLNWLDRDLFLRDMKSGDLKAQFCSPILVNAMLAVACTHSNCSSVYAVPGDIASKGAHFYHEAKRLLESEEGRISLPTVQGLGLLATFAGIAGKDRHGWMYQSHLVYAVQELSQQSHFPYSTGSADMYKRSPQVDHSIWGLFNIATIRAMLHHKQPPIKPPVQHYPPPPIHAEHFWRPYPLQLEGIKVHTDCLFHALCELNRIVYDLGCTFFNYEKTLHRTQLELRTDKLRTRLQDWANQLPFCLKDPEGTQVPHLLSLHMYYYSICITLDQYTPSTKLDPDTNNDSDPHLSNARRISYLMRIHRSSWGIDRIPVSNIVSISTALLALLTNLSDPQNRDAFVNLAVAAKAFSRRWVLGRVKLELVHQQAQEMGVDLPGETKPLFSDLEVTSRKRAKLE